MRKRKTGFGGCSSDGAACCIWRFVVKSLDHRRQYSWILYSGRLALLFYVMPAVYCIGRQKVLYPLISGGTYEDTVRIMNSVRLRLGINREISVYYHGNLRAPMVTGVFRPEIYLPKRYYDVGDMELSWKEYFKRILNQAYVGKKMIFPW